VNKKLSALGSFAPDCPPWALPLNPLMLHALTIIRPLADQKDHDQQNAFKNYI